MPASDGTRRSDGAEHHCDTPDAALGTDAETTVAAKLCAGGGEIVVDARQQCRVDGLSAIGHAAIVATAIHHRLARRLR